VSRMNALWDLLGEREALVVAVTRGSGGELCFTTFDFNVPSR